MKKRHDFLSRKARSELMSRIKSKDTKIELKIALALGDEGVKFERYPKVFGNPDFAIKDRRVAIFCDGDFWHGYRFGSNPRLDVKDNREFWLSKIRANIRRDALVNRTLSGEGWKVVRLWEHEIKNDPKGCARRIMKAAEN